MKLRHFMTAKEYLTFPSQISCPNPNQPRKQFDKEALSELADSIQRYGVLQPITVRKAPSAMSLLPENGGFVLRS
jgi:ParB/RepB/Spo0J family partition protein